MSKLVALRDCATLRLTPLADQRWIERLRWVPLSPTEIQLACRYFPLAVRIEERQRPMLGLLLGKDYIAHTLLSGDGEWRGAYRPIALRCFPFQASKFSNDPLSDIAIAAGSEFLGQGAGLPVLVDGKPNDWVVELHRLLQLLRRGEDTFAGAIDQLLIADLLEPLATADDIAAAKGTSFHVLSPRQFAELGNSALGAMARHNFLSLDLAVAGLFSLQNLKSELRPKSAERVGPSSSDAGTAFDAIAINDLPLALDDGELVPLSDLVPAPAI
jgi:hypothetical protein